MKEPWNILQMIKERPDPMLREDVTRCPFCKSDSVNILGTMTTLLGWSGPVNPNHIHQECHCTKCGETFYREVKGLNVWYTQDRRVLLGIPSCYEGYRYTCADCGGEVTRKYWDLEKKNSDLKCLSWNGGKKQFRSFYECSGCNREMEANHDYWFGEE